ncbi:MAG: T9SS type A sorting domain-containing protein [Ignavibacteria bacterium]|nr:T9SS type A sorting domain-containing protein [Ignavibacteria bacterium]
MTLNYFFLLSLISFSSLIYSQFQIFYTPPENRGIMTIKAFTNFYDNKSALYVHVGGNTVTAQPPYWIRYFRESNQWNTQPHYSFLNGSVCYNGTGGYNWSMVRDLIKGRRDTVFLLGSWLWITCLPPESGIESRITYNSGMNFSHPATSEGAMSAFDFDPLTDSIIYGIGQKFLLPVKLLKTTNKGLNWTSVVLASSSSNFDYSLKVNPLNRNVIYFGTASAFYRSNDGGNTVLNISNTPSRDIAIHPNDTSLLICNNSGIYKSTNGGYNFTQTLNVNTSKLLIHPELPNVVYAGTVNGIYRSANFGSNWVLYFASFSGSQSVTGLAKYKNDLDTIYASNDKYVYKIWASSIGVIKTSGEIPVSFRLYQNYPNPFNPETRIKFQIPEQGYVRISVFDLLGREVASLVNEKLTPGTYEINWNAEEVPGGVYFCRMMTENFSQTIKLALLK